jgi:hypothetical protein
VPNRAVIRKGHATGHTPIRIGTGRRRGHTAHAKTAGIRVPAAPGNASYIRGPSQVPAGPAGVSPAKHATTNVRAIRTCSETAAADVKDTDPPWPARPRSITGRRGSTTRRGRVQLYQLV